MTAGCLAQRAGPGRGGGAAAGPRAIPHTLDQVPHAAYLLDLRMAPRPARQWLQQARPTRDIGPPGDPYRPYALAQGHDLLIHLHALGPATPLPAGGSGRMDGGPGQGAGAVGGREGGGRVPTFARTAAG